MFTLWQSVVIELREEGLEDFTDKEFGIVVKVPFPWPGESSLIEWRMSIIIPDRSTCDSWRTYALVSDKRNGPWRVSGVSTLAHTVRPFGPEDIY